MKDTIKGLWERSYPIILAFVAFLLILLFYDIPVLPTKFDNIVDGIITFSSIIIGFIGVLISILLTLKDTKLIKHLFNNVQVKTLKRYFMFSLFSGFGVIVLSLMLYLDDTYTKELMLVWVFTLTYFAVSAFRIINIMMYILFKEHNPVTNPKGKVISEKDLKALKEELTPKE